MKFKSQNVRIGGVQPELILGLLIFESCYKRHNGNREIVITAVKNGKHLPNGFHPKGLAADVRANDIPAELALNIISESKMQLDRDFDIILEGVGTANCHFHIEFDPKDPTEPHVYT